MKRANLLTLFTAVALGWAPLLLADQPGPAEVTGVSVLSSAGQAEIVIMVRGAVDIKDFTLTNPTRLVVDVVGAKLTGPGAVYDGVNRGGVLDVRFSQYQPDVVRIVVQLADFKDYSLERDDKAIRVTFGADRAFLAWSSTAPGDFEPPAGVTSPRQPEVTPVAAFGPKVPGPRLTVTWDNAEVADVIAGFAAFSGKTIVLGRDVKGKVTAEIKNQPWPEAFAAVLATQGLQAIEMPGAIIRVDSPQAIAALDSIEPLQTRLVRINYVSASSMVGSVKAILTKRGQVVADTTSNSLIMTETRSRLDDVEAFAKSLDIRTPQISIQSKIIFVDRTDLVSLGLQYDIGDNQVFFNRLVQRTDPATGEPFDNNVVNIGGNSIAAIANATSTIPDRALEVVWRTALGGFSLTTFLQALQRVDLSDIQAEPLITTLDNREAEIIVGEDIPVRVVDVSSSTTGQGAAPKSTVQFKETGIKLRVTPHVTNNRKILMQLDAERSDLKVTIVADLGFTIRKQNATSQLLVNDGETAVIGGLTVTEVTRTRSGIPFLADLPFIGKLFSFSTDQEVRRDLIILVTPRIIDDGQS